MTMKKLIFFLLVIYSFTVSGQLHEMGMQCALMDTTFVPLPENGLSYNGYVHTPKDTLHMLVIFRAFNNNTEDWNIGQPDLFWAHDDIPSWAKGASNKLFDSSHHTIGQTLNLSAWFHRMSKGKFIVTGEVFPHLVIQNLKNF